MDFDLMFTSFPKLLGATVVTLKLLSVSLFFGLFIGLLFAILRLNKNIFIKNLYKIGYAKNLSKKNNQYLKILGQKIMAM